MQCSAVQCSAVQCRAVQCSAVQSSARECPAVHCSVHCVVQRCRVFSSVVEDSSDSNRGGSLDPWSCHIVHILLPTTSALGLTLLGSCAQKYILLDITEALCAV